MKIVTLTLSPAFDLHCEAEHLELYHENAVALLRREAGGKGINISRALSQNGIENLAFLLLGDENASSFCSLLQGAGIMCREVTVPGRIRENITIHTANGAETRVSFPSFSVDGALFSRIREELLALLDADSILTLTGRMPNGLDLCEVKEFLQQMRDIGVKLVIDSASFTVEDLCEVRPWLIKPNEEEISRYAGYPVREFADVCAFAEKLQSAGIEHVMVSLGAKGAMLVSSEGAFTATPPPLRAISTIGAGDSSIAGFIAAYCEGKRAPECLVHAVAYGSAACQRPGTEAPRRDDIESIRRSILLEERPI